MANKKITDLTAATALGGTELFEMVQSAASVKATATQIKTFVGNSLNITGGVLGSVTISNAIGQFDSITITTGNVGSITVSNGTFNAPVLNSATVSGAVGNFSSLTIAAGAIPFNTITNQAYGFFYSSLDQTYVSANVAYAVSFDNSAPFNAGVTVASSTQITMAAAGIYEIAVSLQLFNADSADHDATVWFKKNGTNITASATKVTVPKAADGGAIVLTVSGFDQFTAGQYIECYISVEDIDVRLDATASSVGPPAIPSIPSANLTAKRIG